MTTKPRLASMAVAALAVATASLWFLRAPSEHDAARLRDFDAGAISTDLDADLRLMWQTEPLRSGTGEASTLAAIMAASRVFNTVSLVGKTGADVKALLGSPVESSRSVYRGRPFQPLTARGMVYRFDSGSLGWQFNVYCDGDDSHVSEVKRHWIH